MPGKEAGRRWRAFRDRLKILTFKILWAHPGNHFHQSTPASPSLLLVSMEAALLFCSFSIISPTPKDEIILFLKLCDITVLSASHLCESYEGRCITLSIPSLSIPSPTHAPPHTNGIIQKHHSSYFSGSFIPEAAQNHFFNPDQDSCVSSLAEGRNEVYAESKLSQNEQIKFLTRKDHVKRVSLTVSTVRK